jgi:FlaG/FlaF family flagellin (archaellin)
MKRTALALTLILALLFSAVATLQHISLATANPDRGPYLPSPPVLIVQSPQFNTTYYVNDVLLNLTVITPYTWIGPTNITEISYNFDGQVVTLWNLTDYSLQPTQQFAILLNTSTGPHTLQVNIHSESTYYANPKCGDSSATIFPIEVSQTIPFNVNAGAFPPPSVSIASPENKTYDTFDVPLNFTVNESGSQITYSLDGQNNVTAAENITLTGLSYGEHNITVYATDIAGNIGASETITFTVAKEPEPFPTAIVAVIVASVAVVGAGLLVYFKKRKQ